MSLAWFSRARLLSSGPPFIRKRQTPFSRSRRQEQGVGIWALIVHLVPNVSLAPPESVCVPRIPAFAVPSAQVLIPYQKCDSSIAVKLSLSSSRSAHLPF